MDIKHHLYKKTQLKDRVLWYDGDSTIDSNSLLRFISINHDTDGLYVEEISDEIRQYNRFVLPEKQIKVKIRNRDLDFSWNLPAEYKDLDVEKYILDRFEQITRTLSEEETDKRAKRVAYELVLFKSLNFYDILRAIIFIINTLESEQIVWGVGRGSSVSSYVLYIIGAHDVDSVLYDLDVHDFLRV